MLEIRQATTETDFKAVSHFYNEFADWLKQTYPELIVPFKGFSVVVFK
jgi:hypothetical protein